MFISLHPLSALHRLFARSPLFPLPTYQSNHFPVGVLLETAIDRLYDLNVATLRSCDIPVATTHPSNSLPQIAAFDLIDEGLATPENNACSGASKTAAGCPVAANANEPPHLPPRRPPHSVFRQPERPPHQRSRPLQEPPLGDGSEPHRAGSRSSLARFQSPRSPALQWGKGIDRVIREIPSPSSR